MDNHTAPPSGAEAPSPHAGKPDLRESLANDGRVGAIGEVQLAEAEIADLRGIGFDLDPGLYRESPLTPVVPCDPAEFHRQVVAVWLSRDPVLSKAEVRDTGRGLHAILRFDPPLELADVAERDRWAAVVPLVQAALPVDPGQPGITMTTRAIGSVNSRNGRTVALLAPGGAVTPEEVLALAERMRTSPFRTVLGILAGGDRVSPCPVCGKGSLAALDHVGKCYSCSKVTLDDLYDVVFAPAAQGGSDA